MFLRVLFLFVGITYLAGCSKKSNDEYQVPRAEVSNRVGVQQDVQNILTYIEHNPNFNYPDITLILKTNNISDAKDAIVKLGGQITYDPNLDYGHDIPFLVVTFPVSKLKDVDAVKNLQKAGVQTLNLNQELNSVDIIKNLNLNDADFSSLKIPFEEIGVSKLRQRFPNEALGEDTLVAVIDTGVDAAHPVFQDRVIYWADQTQETRFPLFKKEVADGKVTLSENEVVELPENLKNTTEIYVGVFSEPAQSAQLADADKSYGVKGLDINLNGHKEDKFLVLAYEREGLTRLLFDSNANMKIDSDESEEITDFNQSRLHNSGNGFIKFQARNRIFQFPIITEKNSKGELTYASLGIDDQDHGTHVAGIIAANGHGIEGAAPKAKIMSIKVCSPLTCTYASLMRGFLDAFYNPSKLIPDVVNLSIGGPEDFHESILGPLIRDLSAKFGTVFFISASNSGPGFRTLNGIGALGPAIQVGAHVSKETQAKHYRLEKGLNVPDHMPLFFTSLGPSYTGQLRPNIMAPGSALSATPILRGKTAMFNGTSMSSPLMAGGALAMISKLKKDNSFKSFEEQRQRKISDVLEKQNSTQMSLTPYVLMMREILEDTAVKMPNATKAQQGYGLAQVDRAYDKMISAIHEQKMEKGYFELKTNNNASIGKLYDRGFNVARSKAVQLSIYEDGETPASRILDYMTHDLHVVLQKVEVQSTTGEVETLITDMPFSIALHGLEGERSNEKNISLTNNNRNNFYSIRYLEQMEEGKTYLAHYDVFFRGNRIHTVLDVVHKPVIINQNVGELKIPSMGLNNKQVSGYYYKTGVKLKTYAMHRYPILISDSDHAFKVSIALPEGSYGNLQIMVYNPDGRRIASSSLFASEQTVGSMGQVRLGSLLVTPSKGMAIPKGIYEIVIHQNGRWLGELKYDLLVEASRLSTSVISLENLKVGDSKDVILRVQNLSEEPKAEVHPVVRGEIIKGVELVAGNWTFRKLVHPSDLNIKGPATFGIDFHNLENFIAARIDHRLYKRTQEGKFVPVEGIRTGAYGKSKAFIDVNLNEELYFAVETVDFDTGELKSGIRQKFDFMLSYYNAPAKASLATSMTRNLNGFYTLNVKVQGEPSTAGYYTSTINVYTSQGAISIPVTIKADSK